MQIDWSQIDLDTMVVLSDSTFRSALEQVGTESYQSGKESGATGGLLFGLFIGVLIGSYIWSKNKKRKTIEVGTDIVEIENGFAERIYFNGRLKSKKVTKFGALHSFTINSAGVNVLYEISIGSRFLSYWTEVRKDGKLVFTDREKIS